MLSSGHANGVTLSIHSNGRICIGLSSAMSVWINTATTISFARKTIIIEWFFSFSFDFQINEWSIKYQVVTTKKHSILASYNLSRFLPFVSLLLYGCAQHQWYTYYWRHLIMLCVSSFFSFVYILFLIITKRDEWNAKRQWVNQSDEKYKSNNCRAINIRNNCTIFHVSFVYNLFLIQLKLRQTATVFRFQFQLQFKQRQKKKKVFHGSDKMKLNIQLSHHLNCVYLFNGPTKQTDF